MGATTARRPRFRKRPKPPRPWLELRARYLNSTLSPELVATEFGLEGNARDEFLMLVAEEQWSKDRRAAWREAYPAVRKAFAAELVARCAEFLQLEANESMGALHALAANRAANGATWTPFQWLAYSRALDSLALSARRALGLGDGSKVDQPAPEVHFLWVPKAARPQLTEAPAPEVVIVDGGSGTAKPE